MEKYCKEKITTKVKIELTDDFLAHVEKFDFSIFSTKPSLKIIEEHKSSPWFAIRFGGGIGERPRVDVPPTELQPDESRYIAQLFEAYGDHKKVAVTELVDLNGWKNIVEHFNRQRELFFNAESLRNFARDTVPPGTFDELQNEVYHGVIDIEIATHHVDAFARLNAVTFAASNLPLTSNALISVTRIQDKKGICHQLANVDRLTWKKP